MEHRKLSLKEKSVRLALMVSPNAVRFGVLTFLLGLTTVAVILSSIVSCRSINRSKSGERDSQVLPEPTNGGGDGSKPAAIADPGSATLELATSPKVLPGIPSADSGDQAQGEASKRTGALTAGIEVWQDDKPVETIVIGKNVRFRPSNLTRIQDAQDGCASNPGIVQASWTIGSKPSADVQRYAGQDCRDLDYGGMFTKEGAITVRLDVMSAEGEVASSEATFSVINSSH